MQKHFAIGSTVAGLVLALLATPEGRGAYVFTNVADTTTAGPTGIFSTFPYAPAISGGKVAFEGNYDHGSGRGIFTGSGGATTTIAKTGDAAPAGTFKDFGLQGPVISGGTVAFWARYSDGSLSRHGIFTGTGGAKAVIAEIGDTAPSGTSGDRFTGYSEPAISGGTVAFNGSYGFKDSAGGGLGVFTTNNGTITTVTTSNGDAPARIYTYLYSPAVSGGTTAFFGVFQGTGGIGQGIFKDSGTGPTVAIAKKGDTTSWGSLFDGFWQYPAISGETVAFVANYNGDSMGVFNGSGGPPTTIAKRGDAAAIGTFDRFGTQVSISGDTTAFVGVNYSYSAGLYTGSGGPLTTVIKRGDPLFGSSVLELGIGRFGLDDDGSGKIAFYYVLNDLRRGIAIATPSSGLPGDYNQDGAVNAADYTVWRNNLGSTAMLPNDPSPGMVTQEDYDTWKTHFGQTAGSGAIGNASAAVPEPPTLGLLILASVGWRLWRARSA